MRGPEQHLASVASLPPQPPHTHGPRLVLRRAPDKSQQRTTYNDPEWPSSTLSEPRDAWDMATAERRRDDQRWRGVLGGIPGQRKDMRGKVRKSK